MKLTAFTNHSVKVLLFASSKNGNLTNIDEVSKFYDISRNHLMKVVHHLAKGGYIQTVRGKNGGFRLAISEEKINLGKLIQYTEFNLFDLIKNKKVKSLSHTNDNFNFETIVNTAALAFIDSVGKNSLADLTKPILD